MRGLHSDVLIFSNESSSIFPKDNPKEVNKFSLKFTFSADDLVHSSSSVAQVKDFMLRYLEVGDCVHPGSSVAPVQPIRRCCNMLTQEILSTPAPPLLPAPPLPPAARWRSSRGPSSLLQPFPAFLDLSPAQFLPVTIPMPQSQEG